MLRRGGEPAAKAKATPALSRPPYADRHTGAVILVLGNGPSLATHRDALLELVADVHPIVLGANHVTPFTVPDYHAFTNGKRFVEYAHTIDPRSRVLVSPYFPKDLVRTHHRGQFERIAYVADNDARFEIEDGVILAGCRTVSVLLLGVAIVMGAERILVAGLDGFASVAERGRAALSSEGLYHAPTSLVVPDEGKYLEVDRYTRRFLAGIQDYLARAGRKPFAIVTPTAYEGHHDPSLLAPYVHAR